jgi:cytochrome c peroxidase
VQLPGSPVEVEAADALEEWQRSAVVTPNRPMTTEELTAAGLTGPGLDDHRLSLGRALFDATGCVSCHGGAQWTTQTKDFVSPPDPAEVATEGAIAGANASPYLYRFLTDVGTFDINVSGSENELPGYPAIGGAEKDANGLNALGFDYDGDGKGSGYNTPSLLGGHALPPYFHNGACESFACVLASVPHRRAGLEDGQPDPLDDEAARADLALYLTSIDLSSPPHGEAAPPSDATTTAP